MELIESLKWRYATKKMNGQSVQQTKIDQIIEAIHLAPTSSGLQPYVILQITNPQLKEKIKPIAMNQSQITDSSHLLVFAAWDNYSAEKINKVYKQITEERGLPEKALDDYKNSLITAYTSKDAASNFAHTARQSFIGLGVAIAAAAELKIDATPMEGFVNEQLDLLLELDQKGLKSTAILALGYRDEANDWLVNMKKVRTPLNEFLINHN